MRTLRASISFCLVICVGFIFGGCKDDATSPNTPTTTVYTDTLTIEFHPHFGEDHLFIGQQYVDSAKETLIFSKVKFYASEIALVDSTGKETALDGIALVDFADATHVIDGHYFFKVMAPAGTYSGVKFTVGVPYSVNHQDAATQNLPLGPNSDMYWSWNPGYVFMKLEGTADAGSGPVSFAYHLGLDSYTQRVSIANFGTSAETFKLEKGKPNVYGVECNFHKLFEIGIDGTGPMAPTKNIKERILHGYQKPLADRIFTSSIGMFAKAD